jgi:Cu(I)/Ag(I) efflux system membrane fusion protein
MKKTIYSAVVAAFLMGTGGTYASPEIPAGVPSGIYAEDTHAHMQVKGSCEMCKSRIEKAAKAVKGVTSASWDLKNQTLHLNYDAGKTSLEAISKAVAKAGHDTEKNKAEDRVYKALPKCCNYRK